MTRFASINPFRSYRFAGVQAKGRIDGADTALPPEDSARRAYAAQEFGGQIFLSLRRRERPSDTSAPFSNAAPEIMPDTGISEVDGMCKPMAVNNAGPSCSNLMPLRLAGCSV